MTSLLGAICAAAISAVFYLAAPGSALGSGVHAEDFPDRYESPERTARDARHPYFDEEAPVYDGQNYCWQTVWTPQGWRWADICYGYVF